MQLAVLNCLCLCTSKDLKSTIRKKQPSTVCGLRKSPTTASFVQISRQNHAIRYQRYMTDKRRRDAHALLELNWSPTNFKSMIICEFLYWLTHQSAESVTPFGPELPVLTSQNRKLWTRKYLASSNISGQSTPASVILCTAFVLATFFSVFIGPLGERNPTH